MKRLSQQFCAAIAAVLGLGGMASAQYGTPNPYPVIPIPPAQTVQLIPFQSILPAPSQKAQTIPFQSILPVQAAIPQQPVSPPNAATLASANCGSCGTAGSGVSPNPYLPKNTAFGAGAAPVPYAEYCPQCANGCGSYKSTAGFMFGSCKSFFNPCGPIPCNGIGGGSGSGGGCKHCGVFPYGKPYGTGYNTCSYDSYLNH